MVKRSSLTNFEVPPSSTFLRSLSVFATRCDSTLIAVRRFCGVRVMKGKLKEQWEQLCEKATVEQDSEQLRALIREINQMLYDKEQRLKDPQSGKASSNR